MRKHSLVWLGTALILCLGYLTLPSSLSAASKEKVLYSFSNLDGLAPYGALVFGPAGALYGTTYSGGTYGYGEVFQLSPGSNGTWTETVLHSFDFGNDGILPCSGLTFDSAGNLYGTTKSGGSYGFGSIFQLAPGSNGKWTETIIFSFNNNDGLSPYAGLILDAAGNLYGTTLYGGNYGYGTVFQLAPGANGVWTETVLYSLSGGSTDGAEPYGGLVFDKSGNLYGATFGGGAYGHGTVFQLKPGSGGTWRENVLHSFGKSNSKDGINPYDGVTIDLAGNLYGTTYSGGAHDYGTVFKLTPGAKGKWKETLLHSFNHGKGGEYPYAGVVADSTGNLYGTTYSGGAYGYGTVFRLSPGAKGKWAEKVLSSFDGNDGNGPMASLIFDTSRNLYGTTEYGGGSECGGFGCGTVFEIKP